jgi:hypothetical protein
MALLNYGEVVSLRNRLRNDLSKQLATWQLLAQFIAPERLKQNPAFKNDGSKKDFRIIKNQAGRSLRTFQSGMMNGATPRARPWFNLTINNVAKKNTDTSRKYFSNCEAIINDNFQCSNLYRVLPLAYKDLGIFSNSAFAMLPHPIYGFWFYPFAIGTYAFSCDAEGNPSMFTRDYSLTVRQVVEQFAKKDARGQYIWDNIPDWVRTNYEQAKYVEVLLLTMVVVPNPNYNPFSKSLAPSDKKYQSYTYVQSLGGNLPPQISSGFRNERAFGSQEFVKISGFDYFPVIIPRWEVPPEEDYGVDGPGHIALSDIMTLQEMEKWRLEAVAKLIKPPMVGHASMRRHQASILAGGITYVDDQGALAGFKPAFELNPNVAALIQDQAEYTEAIRKAYFEDLFLMLSSEPTVSHVTAREIDEKASERMSALAPVLGQLDQDLNSKLINNAFLILEAAGKLPPRPRELMGENLRPEYISILAQAAKASMMNSVERLANFTTSMATSQQDPSLLKILDAEKIIRMYADYVAADPNMIVGEDEFADIKANIANQQAQQAQAAQQAQGAATAKDLSGAKVGEGSLLDTMLNASQSV